MNFSGEEQGTLHVQTESSLQITRQGSMRLESNFVIRSTSFHEVVGGTPLRNPATVVARASKAASLFLNQGRYSHEI